KGPKEWSPRGPGGRIRALMKHLGEPTEDIEEVRENEFEVGNAVYLVLTDEEADKRATEDIEDSLWAFNAGFIIEHSDLPREAREMVAYFQEKKAEGANDTIRALIKDLKEFVEDAISADGRGHFISHYDGEEHEAGDFFIYRIN